MDHKIQNHQGRSENSLKPVDPVISETIVVTKYAEAENVCGDHVSEAKIDIFVTSSKVTIEERKVSAPELENHTCIIDVKCNGGALKPEHKDDEKICRIFHLSDDQQSKTLDLIQLGCRCKEVLGAAHRHCAETWFKLKGNRCCEICGEAAKNITGVGDNGFMVEGNERRLGSNGTNYSDRRGRFC